MDQFYTNAYIKKELDASKSFNDLGFIMKKTDRLAGFTDILLEKINALDPIYSNSFIWELLRQIYIEQNYSEARDTWMNILTMYSNKLVSSGLFDTKDDDFLASQENIDTLPIVIFASTVDLDRCDNSYIKAAFWTYRVVYNEEFETQIQEDEIGQSTEKDPDDHNATIQEYTDLKYDPNDSIVEMKNVRSNFYTKVDLLLYIYQTWNESDLNNLFDKRGEFVYYTILDKQILSKDNIMCYEDNVMPFQKEDIAYWISYFYVTIEKEMRAFTDENTSEGLKKSIKRKWFESIEHYNHSFPKLISADEILALIISEAITIYIQIHNFNSGDQAKIKFLEQLKDLQSITLLISPATEAKTDAFKPSDKQKKKKAATSKLTRQEMEEDEEEEEPDEDEEEEDEKPDNDETDEAARKRDVDEDMYLSRRDIRKAEGNYEDNMRGIDKAGMKIYRGYKAYQQKEAEIDSQMSKIINTVQKKYRDKKRQEIIEGKKFSFVRVLKVVFTTSAIFSVSKIAGLLYVIVKYFRSKTVNNQERQQVLDELQLEMKMLDEKIEDARGDGNRKAKYSMMRTRAELQKAYDQVRYGMSAGKRTLNAAKQFITGNSNSRRIADNFANATRERY